MTYSKSGLALTERFEQCRLEAYRDVGGVLTIGWGHTAGVHEGDVCTQEQADDWAGQDTEYAAGAVNRLVWVAVNQEQFDALVDLVYNIGAGGFADSTMLKFLNEGQYLAAAEEFDKWDHAGGKVVAGLLRRRQAEAAEFEDEVGGVPSGPKGTT